MAYFNPLITIDTLLLRWRRSSKAPTWSSTPEASSELETLSGSSSNISLLVTARGSASFPVFAVGCRSTGASVAWAFRPWPGCLGARLSLKGGGDDLGRQVEEVPQVLDAFIGQVPVPEGL